jgi:hypothetical protein
MAHLLAVGLLLCVYGGLAQAELEADWSGYLALEGRFFFEGPAYPQQESGVGLSLAFEPELNLNWDDGSQQLNFRPFGRVDRLDSDRTHADIRELEWIIARDLWELRLGVRQIFWGVTESQHLVDIINQTDLVENPDGEDKLGQPMLNLALKREWGTIDLFLMPLFRERTFPGPEGRLRATLPVDTDRARYVSGGDDRGIDWAVRWAHVIGNWDVGLSFFSGTGRDPVFEPRFTEGVEASLIPLYFHIEQWGLDAQLVSGDTLWKLEIIRRAGLGTSFVAAAGGFEYTLYGVFDTAADLGILAEYLHNDKNDARILAFENDLFLGLRLAANDVASTEVLFGIVQDLDDSGTFFNLEASRRLGDDMKLSIEGRFFTDLHRGHPQYAIRDDSYLQLELAHYF